MRAYEMNYKRSIPVEWNGLSAEELSYALHLKKLNLTKEAFNVLFLRHALKIPHRKFYLIPAVEMAKYAEKIEFLHKKAELTVNKFPVLMFRRKDLIGPCDGMTDITFEQYFGYASMYLDMFAETHKDYWLNRFVSALYHEGEFNADNVERNAILIEKLPVYTKEAVLLFYTSCSDVIANRFPELFSKSGAPVRDDLHYFKMLDNIADGALADNHFVKRSNIIEVFIRLQAMHKENEEFKKRTHGH